MKKIKCIFYLFVGLMTCLFFSQVYGQDVILNPGYIQGTVSIDGVAIDQVDVRAYGCSGHDAYTTSYSDTYSLTVHVNDDSCDYNAYCTAYSDSSRDTLNFQPTEVTVFDGATTVMDCSVTPGFVSGTISITDGSVQWGRVYASVYTDGKYTNASTSVLSDGTFSFPVQPNTEIRLYGYVWGADGVKYTLDEVEVDVTTLATVVHDWEIVPGDGVISGNCSLDGITGNIFQLQFYGPESSFTSTSTDTYGDYEVTGLLPGSWDTRVSTTMNSGDDFLRLPLSIYTNPVTVPAGGSVENYITAIPAFVTGRVLVSGSKGIQSIASGTVHGDGIYGDDTYGGYGYDRLDASNGNYDLILTRGDWNVYRVYLKFYETDDTYLNSNMNYYDYSKHFNYGTGVSLEDDALIENYDFIIGTGTATINFEVEGGGIFSDPWVEGACYTTDGSGQPDTYTGIWSSDPSDDITQGSVTFVGTPGTYDIIARATVDGSVASFGELGVVIVEGADVVIDIGAPTLTMTDPDPYYCATGSTLTVSGTASDTSGVASVQINGTEVPFVSTGNLEDENEISFSYDITLLPGANIVETSVTDSEDKTITDRRTVYYDSDMPTLTWTPADGASTQDSQVTVEGTASDDAAVAEISVNGTQILFTSTANGDDPNEVSFSSSLALDPGTNQITVVVTDGCGNTTSQVHEITMTPLCEDVDDLEAVPKSRKVQLVWTPRGGQTYNIYRRTSGEEYIFLAASDSEYSTYLDLNVTNGVTYYYYVKTVCDGVEQSASNEVEATPSRRTR